MKKITTLLFALGFGTLALSPTSVVSAKTLDCKGADSGSAACQAKEGLNSTTANPGKQKELTGSKGIFQQIVNILLFITGAIAVIVIVIGGIKYVLSSGDSNQITSAKNTILYAVIGLVVAILAYAIVNFVIDKIGA